ncbi:MAG: hypothetical protein CVU17_06775 [Betaproteobacteria bacterium HGW-Betaproteobacteria-11]|nr:MAG: hypothetical protein CVU17_06775 [Betaproteobacteria bacterium HGW-Betaproteobacteria-11]
MKDALATCWTVCFAQRQATITGTDGRLTLALDRGERQRLVVSDAAAADALVATLAECPETGLLPADGGLPGGLTVAENLSLALAWDATFSPQSFDILLLQAFAWCGFGQDRLGQLGRRRLLELSPAERWRIGLLRFLVRPPELLVFDRLAAACSLAEAKTMAEGIALYHAVHPFRSSLRIDLAGERRETVFAEGAYFADPGVSCPS